MIEENNIGGNTNGIVIGAGARDNLIRNNVVVGNPAVQISNTRPTVQAADILNLAPASATTFDRNVCVTSVNAPCPAIARSPQ